MLKAGDRYRCANPCKVCKVTPHVANELLHTEGRPYYLSSYHPLGVYVEYTTLATKKPTIIITEA